MFTPADRSCSVNAEEMCCYVAVCMTMCPLQVDCSSAKASILQQATTLRQALQHQIAAAWTDSNKAVSARSGFTPHCCCASELTRPCLPLHFPVHGSVLHSYSAMLLLSCIPSDTTAFDNSSSFCGWVT